jgi:hypothetical protein
MSVHIFMDKFSNANNILVLKFSIYIDEFKFITMLQYNFILTETQASNLLS